MVLQDLMTISSKVIGHQSWQSKNILDLLGSRLRFSRVYLVNCCSPSDPGSIPDRRKLWGPTFLQPLGLQDQKAALLIANIYNSHTGCFYPHMSFSPLYFHFYFEIALKYRKFNFCNFCSVLLFTLSLISNMHKTTLLL